MPDISHDKLAELLDADHFVDYVAEQLADYDDGRGDAAHDVLDRIQAEFARWWQLPDADADTDA